MSDQTTTRPTEHLVKQEFTYLTLEGNEPKEVSETFYLYFTFGTVSEMYKRMGVDEQRAQSLADEMGEADDVDAEAFQEEVVQDVQKSDLEINMIMVWAAMQWHVRQQGDTISVEEVGDMIHADNAEEVLINTMRALEVFQTGALPTYEEMLERREDAEDAAESGKGSRPSSADAQRSPR